MKKTDICFYMSITKEENSAFVVGTGASSSSSQEGRAEPEDPATKDPEKGMKLSECEDRPKPRSGNLRPRTPLVQGGQMGQPLFLGGISS